MPAGEDETYHVVNQTKGEKDKKKKRARRGSGRRAFSSRYPEAQGPSGMRLAGSTNFRLAPRDHDLARAAGMVDMAGMPED